MNKLVYVYFKNLLFFEATSLNLSNDFHCQLIENTLVIEKRTNLFKEVLGETVVDINVIAGENGVGKTQLLKMLAELASGALPWDYVADYDYILLYQQDENQFVLTTNMDIYYLPEPFPNTYTSAQTEIVSPIIYFSPFLDFNPLDINPRIERKPIIDISQSYFVMRDTEQSQKKMDIVPTVLTLKSNNILRQIEFVARKPMEIEMPFRLPTQLSIRFNRLQVDKGDVSTQDNELFDKLTAYCASFFLESNDNGISQHEMAKLMFFRNLLSLYFLSVNNNKSQSVLNHHFDNDLISEIQDFSSKEPVELINIFQRFFSTEDIFKNDIFKRITNLAFSIIGSDATSITFGSNNNHLTLNVPADDPRIVQLLKEIFEPKENVSNKYIVKELIHFISFDWRNFSSGEKAFLDLFARLFSAKKKLTDPSSTVLLLLDEAEVGFHPEWQKRFVLFLVGYLNSVFKGFSIQVILATHSPLVLSDFPTERVHLFKRHNDSVGRMNGFGTFAQNISELLANDFFINTTLIGDLAKSFIDDILKMINEPGIKLGSAEIAEIRSRVEKIDEPVIKQLISDVLNHKIHASN